MESTNQSQPEQPKDETPVEPSSEAQTETPPIVPSQKPKPTKGRLIGIAVASILAFGGIAFGIYGMTHRKVVTVEKNPYGSTNSYDTRDSIVILPDSDTSEEAGTAATGTGTNNRTERTTGGAIEISGFGFNENNFSTNITYDVDLGLSSKEYTHAAFFTSPQEHTAYGFYNLDATGKLEASTSALSFSSNAIDISSRFPGTVIDLAIGQSGNGGDSWIIALLEDGTVATLLEPYTSEFAETAQLVSGASHIVHVYGNWIDFTTLGYVQDETGKIYTIAYDHSDTGTSTTSFKINN